MKVGIENHAGQIVELIRHTVNRRARGRPKAHAGTGNHRSALTDHELVNKSGTMRFYVGQGN